MNIFSFLSPLRQKQDIQDVLLGLTDIFHNFLRFYTDQTLMMDSLLISCSSRLMFLLVTVHTFANCTTASLQLCKRCQNDCFKVIFKDDIRQPTEGKREQITLKK